MRSHLRLVAGAASVLLAAVALTGCSPSGSSGGCTPQARPGDASDAVTASGRFGTAPTVRFAAPLHTATTEATSVTAGSGARIDSTAQVVTADITLVDGTSGTVLQRTPYTGSANAATFLVKQFFSPGIRKALVCARAGGRIAAVLPPGQVATGGQRVQGVAAGDSVVAVIDVRQAYLARADGRNQVMGSGLPAVVLGPDGRPGVTLPEDQPPTTARIADLKVGSGPAVTRGDRVVIQYTGVAWQRDTTGNGSVFGSSWTAGAPTAVAVDTAQIGRGLAAALAGQRVGSQVLAVLPADQVTASQNLAAPPAGSTGVYVIDLLGKV